MCAMGHASRRPLSAAPRLFEPAPRLPLHRPTFPSPAEMSFAHGAGDACVRLLTATGTVGCAAPGTAPADGRLLRLTELLPSAEDYPGEAAACLPACLPHSLVLQGPSAAWSLPCRCCRRLTTALLCPRTYTPSRQHRLPAALGAAGGLPAAVRRCARARGPRARRAGRALAGVQLEPGGRGAAR